MFLSRFHLFSFISMSLPQYNARIVLLETRAFWRYPPCRGPWFNQKKWFVLRHTTKHSHNDGRRRRKCPPDAPHEALRLVPTRQIDGRRPPEQADIILGVLRRVYGPQSYGVQY